MKFNDYIKMLLETEELNEAPNEMSPNALGDILESILKNIHMAIPKKYRGDFNYEASKYFDKLVFGPEHLEDDLVEQYAKTESAADVAKIIIAYVFEQVKKHLFKQHKSYLFTDRTTTRPELFDAIEYGIGGFKLNGTKLSEFIPSKNFKELMGLLKRINADEKVHGSKSTVPNKEFIKQHQKEIDVIEDLIVNELFIKNKKELGSKHDSDNYKEIERVAIEIVDKFVKEQSSDVVDSILDKTKYEDKVLSALFNNKNNRNLIKRILERSKLNK